MSDVHVRNWMRIVRTRFPELLRLHDADIAQHLVQFYEDDQLIIENVYELAAQALEAGSSVVIIATASHLHQIGERLASLTGDLECLRIAGRYVTADADEALSRFMVDGSPETAAFDRAIGSAIGEAAGRSKNGFVFAFGEMVALLCADNNPDGAVRLEQLWNRLMHRHRFSLYCAYPLSSLEVEQNVNALVRICAEHALTIPSEGAL